MPPQQPANSSSPNPQYDFIFGEGQNQKPGFSPKLTSVPKRYLIAGAAAIIVILILVLALFTGGSGNSEPWVNAIGRAGEIARVSSTVAKQTNDINTQALASTTEASLTSERQEIIAYVKQAGIELNAKEIEQYENSQTDKDLQAAAQENRFEEAYSAYLKNNLASYAAALKAAKAEAGPRGSAVIDEALASVEILLTAPQLAVIPD